MNFRTVLRLLAWLAAASVVAYIVIRHPQGIRDLWGQMVHLPAWLWMALLATWIVAIGLRVLRWHLLIASLGGRVPFWRQAIIYVAGFAMGVTPGKAGEAIRAPYLKAWGVSYTHSLGAFVADRVLDLLAVVLLASFSLSLLAGHDAWWWTVMAMAAGGLGLLQWPLFRAFLLERCIPKKWGPLREGLKSMLDLLRGPRLLVYLLLSAGAWTGSCAVLWFTLAALGQSLSFLSSLSIYATALLAGVASFIPGGLGATEAAMVLLLQQQGIDPSVAVAAAVVSRGASLWWSVATGWLAMLALGASPAPPTSSAGSAIPTRQAGQSESE